MGSAAPFLIGLALSAAGTGATIAANEESTSAANKYTKAELNRQKRYRATAGGTYESSLAKSTPKAVSEALAEGKSNLLSKYGDVQRSGATALGSAQSPISQKVSDVAARSAVQKGLNLSAAQLGSYGEWDLQRSIKNAYANQLLNLQSNIARSSESAYEAELAQSKYAGQGLRNAGSVLSALGSSVGMASAGSGLSKVPSGTENLSYVNPYGSSQIYWDVPSDPYGYGYGSYSSWPSTW